MINLLMNLFPQNNLFPTIISQKNDTFSRMLSRISKTKLLSLSTPCARAAFFFLCACHQKKKSQSGTFTHHRHKNILRGNFFLPGCDTPWTVPLAASSPRAPWCPPPYATGAAALRTPPSSPVCVFVCVCVCARAYMCMYMCMYVCICIYMYIYVCIHTRTHTHTYT